MSLLRRAHLLARQLPRCVSAATASASSTTKATEKNENSFETLLRNSTFMALGDFKGRRLVGKIIHVRDDDLYVDFGGKFDAVVKRPFRNANKYQLNTHVVIQLHDTELSSRFLGSDVDMTLLEADATLIGLCEEPKEKEEKKRERLTE